MTSAEIVKALRCCAKGLGHDDACENCKVGEIQDRREYIEFAAANVIERLTAENAALREEANLRGNAVRTYEKKRAKAEAERDALLEYAKLFTGCDTCKRRNYCKSDSECNACEQDVKGNCYCKDCERGSKWEWQGLAEAPEGEKT